MVKVGTRLRVADNTGAKIVECIRILGGSKRGFASVGDIIVASVKTATPGGVVGKKKVVKCVVVRTQYRSKRADGTYVCFDDNAAVILKDETNPMGTRIFGPVARELRERGYLKILSLASEVV